MIPAAAGIFVSNFNFTQHENSKYSLDGAQRNPGYVFLHTYPKRTLI